MTLENWDQSSLDKCLLTWVGVNVALCTCRYTNSSNLRPYVSKEGIGYLGVY